MREFVMHRPWILAMLLLGACGSEAPAPPAAPPPPSPVTPGAAAPETDPGESVGERRQRLIDEARPVVAEWEPERSAGSDPIDPEQRLAQAQAALEEGRIDRGGDSALGIYLELLEAVPGHAEAEAGVDRIGQVLLQRAELALEENRFEDAARDASILRRIRAGDPALAELQRRLDLAHEVGVLLAEAARLVAAGRVLEPEDENAVALYADVLERDPGNAEAQAALERLEADFVARATAAAEAGDYAVSDRLLADATRVQAGSGQVQDASTQIVELRQGRAGELLQQADEALQRRDVARAQQLLGQLERVSVQAHGLEELRARIELARLYGGHAPGQALRDALASGGQAPELVVIPVGEFRMGSPPGEADRRKNEGPRHTVTIARGFALARTEVSVAEYDRFVAATGHVGSAEQAGRSMIYDERSGSMLERRNVDWRRDHAGARAEPDLPVVHVSWEDAKAYADWLSRETGASYRLPSEAEFEYALRAGSTTRYPWGDGAPPRVVGNLTGQKDRSATSREWTNAFAGYGDGFWGPAPVRAYRANPFGLHDMEGNVSEWVEDCWHDTYARAPADGSAWVNPGCKSRVVRGGSWASSPDQARAAFRLKAKPTSTNARVGFRVVREL